jgi:hypothetical protein
MTPKMIAALSAAEAAIHHRGLERTVAGWHSTHPRAPLLEHYAANTVLALVERGYLQLYGKGKATVAHITDAGEKALAEWREEQAA